MNDVKTKPEAKGSRPTIVAPRSARDLRPIEDLTAYIREYARQQPEKAAVFCVGLGFILGWKLKLW
jgi:hypothetical protein